MIHPDTIKDLRDLPIYDVISRYSDITLKKSSSDTYVGKSPWTAEKTGSFFVSVKKNMYKCFSSGKGSTNPIKFVMDKEGVDFVEACKSLASQHGITIQYTKDHKPEDPAAAQRKFAVREAFEWAAAHFGSNPIPDDFLKKRALPTAVIESFKLGFAKPSWDDLLNTATAAGYTTDVLLQGGLIRKREGKDGHYDALRDRVIIPIMDYRGNIVGFTGRDAATAERKGEVPKYQHTEGMDKSKHLFGLYQALQGDKLKEGAYLVEGPIDVLRWHACGITNTVGKQGSDFSEDQAKLLKRFTDKLILVPDNDCDKPKNAGIESMHRNAPVAIKAGFTVKVLIPGV